MPIGKDRLGDLNWCQKNLSFQSAFFESIKTQTNRHEFRLYLHPIVKVDFWSPGQKYMQIMNKFDQV